MPYIRISCGDGEGKLVPTIYRRGIWAVIECIPFVPGCPGYHISHIPSGFEPCEALPSEDAFNLCRLLGERFPDLYADAPFNIKPPLNNELMGLIEEFLVTISRKEKDK